MDDAVYLLLVHVECGGDRELRPSPVEVGDDRAPKVPEADEGHRLAFGLVEPLPDPVPKKGNVVAVRRTAGEADRHQIPSHLRGGVSGQRCQFMGVELSAMREGDFVEQMPEETQSLDHPFRDHAASNFDQDSML